MRMRKIFGLFAGVSLALLFIFAASEKMQDVKEVKAADTGTKSQSLKSPAALKPDLDFGNIPLYFITNQGQVNAKARFYAKASRYTLWMTKQGLVFDSVMREKGETTHPAPTGHPSQESDTPHPLRGHPSQEGNNGVPHSPKLERDVSRLMFMGANKNPELVALDKAALKVNYFIGSDKSKWYGAVPTSMAVLYRNLYKNIDLKVYGIEKQIEYDWIVKAGGDPEDIRFEYKNIKGTRLDEVGNLLIETDFGELIHKKPVSYQEMGIEHNACRVVPGEGVGAGLRACPKKRRDVNVTFKKITENTYGFEVGAYDKSRELIIDPVVLAYSTYLGGGNDDYSNYIAVDGSGNAYVVGITKSSDFPTLNQYQGYQGEWDVIVTKLDPTQSGASSLLYSTYLGGGSYDYGWSIAVDGSGNAYVTGYTYSTNFPILNQFQGDQGECDVFITRLDPTQSGTSSLLYSTYLGGGSSDFGFGIAVDGSGNAYVTGYTYSTNFPIHNQYQGFQGECDVFVTRLDPTQSGASSLLYSTYLGGEVPTLAMASG